MANGWPSYPAVTATNGTTDGGLATVSGAVPVIPPTANVGKRLRLENGPQIRREIVKCYRSMKAGEIDVNKGTKLIYALEVLSRAVEREAVERLGERLDAAERRK